MPADVRVDRARVDTSRVLADSRELERKLQIYTETFVTQEEHAVGIVQGALETLGANSGVAMRLTRDGDTLEMVGAAHVPAELSDAYDRIPIHAALPLAEAARTGHPCYCESREQLLEHFPEMAQIAERLEMHALAAVPVRYLTQVQGAIAFGFPTARCFSVGEKAQLRALGARYARALRNARRYFAEHDARIAEAAGRRTAEEARAVAEAMARVQGDYVAVISHELRTPLQAILGYAELLTEGVAGELSPRQREFAGRIVMGSMSLLQIVENLLGFSAAQIGRQDVNVEPFDLGRVVDDVVVLAEPLALRKALRVRVEVPRTRIAMTSDPRKVRQIVTNLLANAIKFTESGEVAIAVSVTVAQRVRIDVRDTGVGIPESELRHLFEPFWRGRQQPGAGTGTGLGLSIVQQLAGLLDGEVTVVSTPGQGSVFTIDLPLTLTGDPSGARA